MPTYQYECSSCGHNFDILQSMSENRLKTCPRCGRRTLNRLISAGSGVIFKGSGFYETDYKRKTPAPPAESISNRRAGPHHDGAGPVKGDSKENSASKSKSPSDKSSHGCSPQCGCAL